MNEIARRSEAHRLARNLVWKHLRSLPADLAIAYLFANFETGTAPNPKFRPRGEQAEALVAADWLREHGFTWQMKSVRPPPRMTAWRPMTEREVELATALTRCRFAPATFDKRFARTIGEQAQTTARLISPRQSSTLLKVAIRYRRQLVAMGVRPPFETQSVTLTALEAA